LEKPAAPPLHEVQVARARISAKRAGEVSSFEAADGVPARFGRFK
jgi:hypothetical protein